jgi:hypothetical protein
MTQITQMTKRDIITDEFVKNHVSSSFTMSGIMERGNPADLNIPNGSFPFICDNL